MNKQASVIASLEGMRITVSDKQCLLYAYDFKLNCQRLVETAPWPMSRDQAESWIYGWNDVDGRAAIELLTGGSSDDAR